MSATAVTTVTKNKVEEGAIIFSLCLKMVITVQDVKDQV